jgi:hypothetical protein
VSIRDELRREWAAEQHVLRIAITSSAFLVARRRRDRATR